MLALPPLNPSRENVKTFKAPWLLAVLLSLLLWSSWVSGPVHCSLVCWRKNYSVLEGSHPRRQGVIWHQLAVPPKPGEAEAGGPETQGHCAVHAVLSLPSKQFHGSAEVRLCPTPLPHIKQWFFSLCPSRLHFISSFWLCFEREESLQLLNGPINYTICQAPLIQCR